MRVEIFRSATYNWRQEMTDIFTQKKRGEIMSRIRAKNTSPERIVKKVLSKLKYRFRSHIKNMPGTPDIVVPTVQTAIFVHGCFWHQHQGCRRCSTPSSNQNYWGPKLIRNIARFRSVRRLLRKDGWNVVVVWECQTKDLDRLSGWLQSRLAKCKK